MKSQFAVFALSGILLTCVPVAWSADAASDKLMVKQQTAALPALKKAIVDAIGIDDKTVNVNATAHLITIKRHDAKLNAADSSGREIEAQKIVVQVEAFIKDKSDFSQIATIHVDYVETNGKKSKLVQAFEFNKSAAGSFPIHKS